MSSQQIEDQHARRVTRDAKSDVKSAAAELKSRVEMASQQKEDQRTCQVTRKKLQARQMLGTSRIAVFFQWFVVPDVRKVGSLKRRVRR